MTCLLLLASKPAAPLLVTRSQKRWKTQDHAFTVRGTTGRYWGGPDGIAGKLSSHLRPQSEHSRIALDDYKADKGKESAGEKKYRTVRTQGYKSLAAARQRVANINSKQAWDEDLHRRNLEQLKPKSAVKRLGSFELAFGAKPDLHGKGLSVASSHTQASPAEVASTTVTGLPPPNTDEATARLTSSGLTAFKQIRAIGGKALSMAVIALEAEGWSRPTAIQGHLWLAAATRRDIVALAVPGSGKTAAYIIPAVARSIEVLRQRKRVEGKAAPSVLVLVPSPELAGQVHALCAKLSNPCGISSGCAAGASGRIAETTDIIVGTPFRIGRLIKSQQLTLCNVSMLVIDEADHLLTHKTFEVESLLVQKGRLQETISAPPAETATKKKKKKLRAKKGDVSSPRVRPDKDTSTVEPEQQQEVPLPERMQLLMVSSTWSPAAAAAANPLLNEPVVIRVGEGLGLPSISHRVHVVPDEDRAAFVASMFTTSLLPLDHVRENKYIVFASQKEDVERLYDMLRSITPHDTVTMMHEQQSPHQRTLHLESIVSGSARILVATDLVARGIHIDMVNAVINYDLPDQMEVMTHRLGRTGRGTRYGAAHTLLSTSLDKSVVSAFVQTLNPTEITAALSDLVRRPTEKSLFVKKLEMESHSRNASFDAI
ncbi:ATP-dependent RNA helicase DBP2 [Diplonema papillatum]|nr:ATP-dependent RNA helicase DBP2 [Diplonema papillatum]